VYAEALAQELSGMVREHAGEQHYSFLGPVTVAFEQDAELETGRFRVRSAAVAAATPAEPTDGSARDGRQPWLEVGSTTYPLAGAVTRVGRGTDSDLRIDDPGISRDHAEFRRDGTEVTVVDNGSTNGVTVDGRRVQEARLGDGARVVLGSTTLVFHAAER
jgi:hypothetical protein